MVYLVYEQFKRRYSETQQRYNEILSEKEELFTRTLPKSMQYDRERVSGGNPENPFENYVIEKEKKRIDERLNEVKSLLIDRKQLLDLKEQELRQSKVIIDKVYRMRFLDRMRVNRIASNLGYAESHIYRFLKKIDMTVKDDKK